MANAVLDGVDGMLLGAETLRGHYPVETVDTVMKLAGAAEQHFDYRRACCICPLGAWRDCWQSLHGRGRSVQGLRLPS